MSKRVFNVAILGCGSMGVENIFEKFSFPYSFFEAATLSSRAELVALIDSDLEKLSAVQNRLQGLGYPRLPQYSSLDAAVKNGEVVDIVCCAAGPAMNFDVIKNNAFDIGGVRGVYCEKPMTLSLVDADKLVMLERSSLIKIQVNYLRNHDEHHSAVVDFIRSGGIGELLTVRALYKGGVLAVLPHTTALLHSLFDKAISVSGVYSPLLNTRCLEDPNIDGVVRYFFAPQNREINVQVTATGRGELENNTYLYEFEFTGTKGRITILENGWRTRYEVMESSRVFGSLGGLMPYDSARIPLELKSDSSREFMVAGLENLMDAIENGCSTSCSASCARDAEEIAHALAISAAQRGKIVELPLIDRDHAFADAKAGVKILKKEQLKENK